MSAEMIGPFSLIVSIAFGAFTHFLPPLSEVRRGDPANNPDLVGDVRMGEIAAITLTIGVGTIMSSLAKSPVPAFMALLIVLVLVCLYETALNGNKPGNPKRSVTERATHA